MFGSSWNSWCGNLQLAQFQCEICNCVVFGIDAFVTHYDYHFLESFPHPSENIIPGILPQNGGAAYWCAPPPPPLLNNYNSTFPGVPQPFSSEPIQLLPSQLAASPQVPVIPSGFPAVHEIDAPPAVHVNYQRWIAPANSSTSGTMAKSDGEEEEDIVKKDCCGDDVDDTISIGSSCGSN